MEIRDKGLYIGADAEKIVVAPYPLRLKSGRAVRRRSGSVTEVIPVPPSGRTRENRIGFVARLAPALLRLQRFLRWRA